MSIITKTESDNVQHGGLDLSSIDAFQTVPILFNDQSFDSLIEKCTILEPAGSAIYFKIDLICKGGQIIRAVWDSGARSSIFLDKFLKNQAFVTNKLVSQSYMEVVGATRRPTNVYQVLIPARDGLPYSHVSCSAMGIPKIISATKSYDYSDVMEAAYIDYFSSCSRNGIKPISKKEWPLGYCLDGEIDALLGINSLTFQIIHNFRGLIFITHNLNASLKVSVGGLEFT